MVLSRFFVVNGLILAFLFNGCSKDQKCNDPTSVNYEEVDKCLYTDSSQHALYFKFTGTWCPPCGSSGAIKMRRDLDDNPRAIGIEVHYNDEMSNPISNKWVSHFGNTTFPSFYVNNDEGSLSNALSAAAQVGMAIDYEIEGDDMLVSTYMKALQDIPEKDYYIAVYLLEDGYVSEQYATDHSAFPEWEFRNGRYPEYIHYRTLRSEAVGQIFGQAFYKGLWNDQEVRSFETKLNVPQGTTGTLYPVVGLWERIDRINHLVNATSGL